MDTSDSNPLSAAATPKASHHQQLTLEPDNARSLALLCGQLDQHLQQIEERLGIEIKNRGNAFSLIGDRQRTATAAHLLHTLYKEVLDSNELSPEQVHLALQASGLALLQARPHYEPHDDAQLANQTLIRTKKCTVKPRGPNQQLYVRAVQTHDINFGIGPAGTGKTYLAVACAVESLLKDEVERILLVRPAVEAGEKLGFLPGDLAQKVDPYLRPLYDALYEMIGFETVAKLIDRKVIEVAPLAYMRGRTLNNAFIILDESQNTTREQMKMFLTRIGFGSTAVITGDPSQIDLPRGQKSGLKHSVEVLKNVTGISFTHFESRDVVRHPLVQRIVEAYDAQDEQLGGTH